MRLGPAIALSEPGREALPIGSARKEAAVARRLHVLTQLVQMSGHPVGGERHHLELVRGAAEAEMRGQALVDEAERLRQGLLREHVQLAAAHKAEQV